MEKTPAEVIQDLEEVLSTTIEELEQQKRLNQSLLKRKVRAFVCTNDVILGQ